jgi:lipoic acid synthetase
MRSPTPIGVQTGRKPSWLKVPLPTGPIYSGLKDILHERGLHTVCEEARCPNLGECWAGGTATFMLLGDVCTRACRFCAVTTGNPKGVVDTEEPEKVAEAVAAMKLRYVVLTSVDRDDLPDQGALHFAATVRAIKRRDPGILVEGLIPDFQGRMDLLELFLAGQPDVLAQNLETVERLTHDVRDRRAGYWQTLDLLKHAKDHHPELITKSSLMLGLGEHEAEVDQAMLDLRSQGVDVLTLGQYLRPTYKHLPVMEFVTPARFKALEERALRMGFLYVASGPLVRSSYKAGEYFIEHVLRQRRGVDSGRTLTV